MLRHMKWAELGEQEIAILIPTKDFKKPEIERHYIEPLEQLGISRNCILVINLGHNTQGKYPITKIVNPWIDQLERVLPRFNIKHLIVCEGTYFKKLTNVSKAEPHYGYALPTKIEGITASVCPNYQSLFYNPRNKEKIDLALEATVREFTGQDHMFSKDPTTECVYPKSNQSIRDHLLMLHGYDQLACDIETYSLKVDEAGLGTIAFAWDKEHGIAFNVNKNNAVRQYLKDFFRNYKGKLIFHNAAYDTKVIIWELFMDHSLDYFGMLQGLDTLFNNLDDTKILAYLSQNSTTDVDYKLKSQAFSYTGNYAVDVEDITKIEPAELLKYNVTDCLATIYCHERDYPIVMRDQKSVYEDLFQPALKVITQMELCGMPINMGRVLSVETELDDIAQTHMKAIMAHPIIHEVEDILRTQMAEKATAKLKKKVKTKEDYLHERFNPGSHLQLQVLLYNHLGLPVLDKTDTGQPATGAKTLKALTKVAPPAIIPLLEDIIEWSNVNKILNTFIPAFRNNSIEKDGWHYLHGGFNLGGTKSGRLSSSKPNLQNLPSTGTDYAKIVKSCFQAPPFDEQGAKNGWIFVGADFASLEDRISALQTKDPNKLKIYVDGYDGHCLRAYSYFADQMQDIDPDSVESINSIAKKYPDLRQASKSPTFLLTYMGTQKGLKKTFGFSQKEADKMYEAYHEMYKVSDQWVDDHIKEAQKKGYVDLAFGLRLRTPILPQVILDKDSTPFQAHKETKTAGNALGQSYGLLNTRAANEFLQRVWNSPYRYDVLPSCQIHDSLYWMVRNRLDVLEWVNRNLIECMKWNELPEIQHEVVKLEAELEVYYPTWNDAIRIPNNASKVEIKKILKESL